MPNDANGAAVLRPWTVKAMPEELTQRAAAAARRRQETVAELVSRALVRELDNPTVVVRSDQPQPSKPANGSAQHEPSKPSIADVRELAEAAARFAETSDRMPPGMRAAVSRVIRDTARGYAPAPARSAQPRLSKPAEVTRLAAPEAVSKNNEIG